jgi:glycosyltransferase involved in cell wall biosynthesis
MRKCTALVNPSFFEGWSSTVEEAKSLGKRLVISDIPVHREQNPDNAFYFDPKNENELADILETIENSTDRQIELSDELKAHLDEDLLNRTISFSGKYYKIVKDLMNNAV